MSIEKLEKEYKKYLDIIFEPKTNKRVDNSSYLICLTGIIVPILKQQSDQIADLRQELDKKEDAINIDSVIKEARLRNG